MGLQPTMSDFNRPEEIIQRMLKLIEESRRLKQRHDELMEEHEKLRQEFEKLVRDEAPTQVFSERKMSSALSRQQRLLRNL